MHLYAGTHRPWTGQAGRLAWILALVVASILLFFTYPLSGAEAQETPGVKVGDGTVQVGDDVSAGDGCARAGSVTAGDCGESSGAEQTNDTPDDTPAEKTDDQPGNDAEPSTPGEETTGADPNAGMGETTQEDTVGPETTGLEGTGSTNDQNSKGDACPAAPSKDAQPATVKRAVDGDTLELKKPVDGYDRVRLIGVDTPELNSGEGDPEPHAEKATVFTTNALEGKEILLEIGSDKEDPYGRLLAYVWIEPDNGAPELFNETLLSEGHARLMTVEPNDAYAECFAGAEKKAREDKRGLWFEDGNAEGKDEFKKGLLGRIQDLLSSNDDPSGFEKQHTPADPSDGSASPEAQTTALTQPDRGSKAGGSTTETPLEDASELPAETTSETPEETTSEITSETTVEETSKLPAQTTAGTTGEVTEATTGLADAPPENCPGATTVLEPFGGTKNAQSPPFETTGGAFVVRADLQGEDPSDARLDVSTLDTEVQEPLEQFDQRTVGSYDTRISRGSGSYLLDLKPQAGAFKVTVFDCADEPAAPQETGSHEPATPDAQLEQKDPGAQLNISPSEPELTQYGDGVGGDQPVETQIPAEAAADPVSSLPTRNTASGDVPVLPDTGGPSPGRPAFIAVSVLVASLGIRRVLRQTLTGRTHENFGAPR